MSPKTLQVRVPCSTSNLGPGFDCLGLALSLFLDVRLRVLQAGAMELRGGPAGEDPAQDLVCRALRAGLRAAGRDSAGLRVEQRSAIPLARGLGSSGAAVAAGLLLADALAPGALSPALLVELGLELEGHPDNVVASLRGGLVHSVPGAGPGGSCIVLEQPLSRAIGIAVAWPDTRLSTERARAALPREVPFADAVENARRLPLLLRGLATGAPEQLRAGAADALHMPYRLPLLPGAAEALETALAAGAWMATVSGSGSALIALGEPTRCPAIGEAMAAALRAATGAAEARVLTPVFGPPAVRELDSAP